jgi:nitroreductase
MKMDQILENIETRRSVRKYTEKTVRKEDIDQIIEAGIYAPSGMGRQSSIVIAVTDPVLRNELSKMNAKAGNMPEGTDPFYGAPAVLVVLADKSCPTYIYDGSLTMGNMMLMAHELGLGSCWIHRAKEEFESSEGKEILKKLGIHGDYEGIGHCILGYADGEEPEAKERKQGRIFTASI